VPALLLGLEWLLNPSNGDIGSTLSWTFGGLRSAKAPFLVSSDLDFDSLVRLPGVLRGLEGILGHPPHDSRTQAWQGAALKDRGTRPEVL
jgi:hypothetical protein